MTHQDGPIVLRNWPATWLHATRQNLWIGPACSGSLRFLPRYVRLPAFVTVLDLPPSV